VVLVTSLDDTASRIRGLEAGADDFVNKPFNALELRARIRSLLRIKCYTDALDGAETVIVNLALAIEARDATTAGHCMRLAEYASGVGRSLGLDDGDVAALARGGILHDVGKIGIPDAVLLKPGPLTAEEFELIKQHTTIGERFCCGLGSLTSVRPIVRHHHERLDGSGYPDGLRGDATPLLAQIMGIVDVFDALTTSGLQELRRVGGRGAAARSGALAPRSGRRLSRAGRGSPIEGCDADDDARAFTISRISLSSSRFAEILHADAAAARSARLGAREIYTPAVSALDLLERLSSHHAGASETVDC
jgi:CheY-like chemotaxis protein